jgi:hypothetical protein
VSPRRRVALQIQPHGLCLYQSHRAIFVL